MKILTYGDGPYTSTGYGQVWNNLLKRFVKLRPDWEFKHLSWQSHDRPHKIEDGYTVLPTGNQGYGFDTTLKNLMEYQPDIFMTLCDVGWQSGYIEQVREAKMRGWKGVWIAYTPIDSHAWEKWTWSKIFDEPDINVAMAQWGYEVMNRNGVPNLKYIKHGVDLVDFYPIKDKNELKTKFNMKDKFVVGFVGRNQKRKMIDRMFWGFSLFAKGKDDVLLMPHTDEEPVQNGWSLPYLCENYGLNEKVRPTKTKLSVLSRQDINPNKMNDIYNLMDVFLYPTGGEGFGLPAIECQASGIPLLMSENTTGFELTEAGKHGMLIPTLKDTYGRDVVEVGTNTIEFTYPDDVAMAKILEIFYNDWKKSKTKLKEESIKARKFAEKYNWDDIAKEWINLFEECK